MSCELASVGSESRPRAKKSHQCVECRGTIAPGEIYVRMWGVWEGQAESFKTCLECDQLRDRADAGIRDPEERTAFGMLWETLAEQCNKELLQVFVGIVDRRGGSIPPWLRVKAGLPSGGST